MARSRRRYKWLPFSSGDNALTLTAGQVVSFDAGSILEVELGRELENYTVERLLVSLQIDAGSGTLVFTSGFIAENEATASTTITPQDNPNADWMWHEEFFAVNGQDAVDVHRDLTVRRSLRGQEQILRVKVENRDGADSALYHISGRVLVSGA